jgi:hypothetical protein
MSSFDWTKDLCLRCGPLDTDSFLLYLDASWLDGKVLRTERAEQPEVDFGRDEQLP